MRKYLLPIVLSLASFNIALASTEYYYSNNQKIYIEPILNKKVYKLNTNKEKVYKVNSTELKQVLPKSYFYKIEDKDLINNNLTKEIKLQTKSELIELPFYKDTKSGEELIITDDYLVSFKKELDDETIKNIISDKLNSEIVDSIHYVQDGKGYHLKLKNPLDNVIEVSNVCVESGWCVWASPNFVKKKSLHSVPTDTYYKNQWHLKNTGQNGGVFGADINVENAWDLTKGDSNITIAVIDDGFDWDHEEFSARGKITKRFNLVEGGVETKLFGSGITSEQILNILLNVAGAGNFSHGTSVGGLAAASENGKGVVGVCPNCMLLPIRIAIDLSVGTQGVVDANAQDFVAASGIAKAADEGADIINCSWGGGTLVSDIERNAIDHAQATGRSGKGAILVFSAGNGVKGACQTSSVFAPANYSPVIAVGASTNVDRIAPYSSTGPEVDLVAPSSGCSGNIVTTDLVGLLGYSPKNAIDTFTLTLASYFQSWAIGVGDYFARDTGTFNSWSLDYIDVFNNTYNYSSPLLSLPIPDGLGTSSPVLVQPVTSFIQPVIPQTDKPILIKNISFSLNITHPNGFDLGALLITPNDEQLFFNISSFPGNFRNGASFIPINMLSIATAMTLPSFELDDNGNYTNSFSGTSAAAPIVSGLAGLILSANPNLTYQQVEQILKNTSDKIDAPSGGYDNVGHSNIYGYGRINAFNAVKEALRLKNSPVSTPVPTATPFPGSLPPQTNPTATPVITSSASIRLINSGKVKRSGYVLSASLTNFPNNTQCLVSSKLGNRIFTTIPSSFIVSGSSNRSIRIVIPKNVQRLLRKTSDKAITTQVNCPSVNVSAENITRIN